MEDMGTEAWDFPVDRTWAAIQRSEQLSLRVRFRAVSLAIIASNRFLQSLSLGQKSPAAVHRRPDYPRYVIEEANRDAKRPKMMYWPPGMMEDLIAKVNNCDENGYFVCKAWLFSLDEHGSEKVMSALRINRYLEIYETHTTILYERMEETVQPNTFCDDPSPPPDDSGSSVKIEEMGFITTTPDGELVEFGPSPQPFDNEMQVALVQNNETSRGDSSRSQLGRREQPLTTSDVILKSFKRAVKDSSQYSYGVSTEWLSTLNAYQIAHLSSTLSEAGLSRSYKTSTTTHFERVKDPVQNSPGNQRETMGKSHEGIIVSGVGSITEPQGSVDLQGLRIDENASSVVTTRIEAGPTNVKCLCTPQVLKVSFRRISQSRVEPLASSSQRGNSQYSTRQPVGDCFVTMLNKQRGPIISIGLDKDITMKTVEYTGTGDSKEVLVDLNVSAEVQLSCCLRSDHDGNKVQIDFLEVKGEVQLKESVNTKTNALVLKSVRTNVDACIKNTGAEGDFEMIRLKLKEGDGHSSWCRVLDTYNPRILPSYQRPGDNYQSYKSEPLVWLALSGKRVGNSELMSKTLELQCSVYPRFFIDRNMPNTEALGLHFDGAPVAFEGDIFVDLKWDSVLELNLRYEVQISYNQPRHPLPTPDRPYLINERVTQVVDFDCILELRTETLGG
ncbi:unnamed protein product [Calypogeia fissa]